MSGRAFLAALAVAAITASVLTLSHSPAKVAARSESVGVSSGPAPWAPEYGSLDRRIDALQLPGQSDSIFHIHALLRIYVNGAQVPVPAQIGIDPLGRFLAPLHTHDATGIVHIEADRVYPFTLGQFFTIWGVKFTDAQVGSYTGLRVYVNGRRVAHPASYVMRAHDRIIVGVGPPGSYPTTDSTPFPPGL